MRIVEADNNKDKTLHAVIKQFRTMEHGNNGTPFVKRTVLTFGKIMQPLLPET